MKNEKIEKNTKAIVTPASAEVETIGLQGFTESLNRTEIYFMAGRDKGEMSTLIGETVTIRDYDFIKTGDEDEDYAVFIIDEDVSNFYFGGSIITDKLKQIEESGYHATVFHDGLPTLFKTKKSKNGRNYTNVAFYPKAD